MNRFAYIFLFLLFPLLCKGQLYYPPTSGNTWDTIAPADMGYCSDSINALYNFLEQNNTKAFILLKDGKIVLEKYFGSFTADSNWYWASAGKTLTATLIGIAQQNKLLSINDTTSKYLGKGWTNCTPAQENKITIRHQLTMTTGLDDGVTNPDCTQPSCLQYKGDAGTRWAYHNAPYTLLDSVLQIASGNTINQLVTTWLKNPTGMNGAYIKLGDNMVYFSTARSMARFGLLLLSKGIWNNTPVLSDTGYYNSMVNSSQNLNLSYGYLTWLNGKSSFMIPQTQVVFNGPLNADAPADMFAALGKNAQLINIVPSQDIVWIRMGEAPPGSSGLVAPPFNNDIWQRLNRLQCAQSVPQLISGDVSIYPNPVSEDVYIKSDELITRVHICNLVGNKVLTCTPSVKQYHLSLFDLPRGIYLLHAELKNGRTITKKLIKE